MSFGRWPWQAKTMLQVIQRLILLPWDCRGWTMWTRPAISSGTTVSPCPQTKLIDNDQWARCAERMHTCTICQHSRYMLMGALCHMQDQD